MRTSRLIARVFVAAAATAVIATVLGPAVAASATTLLQPTSVNVGELTGSGAYNYPDNLWNCGTANSSATPGDYSVQAGAASTPTNIGNDTGGLQYGFDFPSALNQFSVTLTAPAPAEPTGVPDGVYGTIFPPESQHIDDAAADTSAYHNCDVTDFTVYNYAVALTINGENWLYTPSGVTVNSAQNEVTVPVDLGGETSSIDYATGDYDSGPNTTTVTYSCGTSSGTTVTDSGCPFADGEKVTISGLGSVTDGPNLNFTNETVTSVGWDTFTIVVAGNYGGDSAQYQNATASVVGLPQVTAMTIYVANVVNPPAATYPGVDYTVDVVNNAAGSDVQYSTVPAPSQTVSLTYVSTGTGDPLTSSLAISSNSITATNVPSQGATVTATVRDEYWNPVVGETVYVGVKQPLAGAIFTEPTTTGSGAGGLPQTASDGTVQYYAWGTKATDPDLPAALFGQATSPDSFYFAASQSATVTEACGINSGDDVTYTANNNFTVGESVSVSGLPVTSNGDDPDVKAPTYDEVTAATATTFTLDIPGVYDCASGIGLAEVQGLTASNLSGSSNGSVYTLTGANNFAPGEQVILTDFIYNVADTSAPSVTLNISSATSDQFSGTLATGSAWTTNAVASGGTASTTSLVTAAKVTAAVGDGTVITYTADNSFSAGETISVQGLTGGGASLNVSGTVIATASPGQFTVLSGETGSVSGASGLASASGPLTVTMSVAAATPSPPSAGPASNGVSSSVQACSGGSPCTDHEVSTSVEVGNATLGGGDATVTVTLADQFGNYDTDRAVELTPIQPSGSNESFKQLSITPLEPADNDTPVTTCDQGPAADLPDVSCTDDNGTTSFLVRDSLAQTVSFQIIDVTDGFTMPTTDLPPEDAPNIPIVTFTVGPVDAANSTVSVDGGTSAYVPANGTSYATVTETLRDAFGNPEPNVTAGLAGTTGGAVTVTAASGDGSVITYLADNTFTSGGTVTVTGLGIASGSSLNVSGATISSATATQFTVNSATTGVASGSGTATPGEHDVVTEVDDSTCTTAPTAGETDCNGQAWFEVSDAYLETVTYTASANSTAIPQAGTPIVNFVTGEVSYADSSVQVQPTTIVGSGRGTATVTVTVKDDGQHPLDGISVALDPSDAATVTAASGNGTTVTYTAANNFTAGQLVSIVGLGQLSGSSLNLTDVLVATASATQFTVTNDALGVASGSGTATLNYQNLTIVPPEAQTNANGQAIFTVTAGAFAGSVTLPTTVAIPVDVSPAPLNGHTPIPSPLTADITVAPTPTATAVVAAPEPSQATVTAASGDGTTVTYTATNGFAPGQVVTVAGLSVSSGSALDLQNVTILTDSGTQFTVRSSLVGVAAGTGTATVSTPVADGSDDELVTATVLNGVTGIAGLSLELVDTDGDDLGTGSTNGSGVATFQASLAGTASDFSVTYVVKDLSDGGRVVGTAAVTYVPAATEAAESTVTASPTSVYTYDVRDEAAHADQQTATVTVHLVDQYGDAIVGDTVGVAANSAHASVDGNPVENATTTDGNGNASFAVTDCNPSPGTTCDPVDVTAASGNGATATYAALDSNFVDGQTISISGLGIASGSSLNLNDVVVTAVTSTTFSVASTVVGVALVPSATVTAASGDGTTVTYTADNGFSPGQTVTINGLGVASGDSLDLTDVTIASATPTQFTVLNSANGVASGSGTATAPGLATPRPNPETVTFSAYDFSTSTLITRSATVNFVLRPDEAIESTIAASPTVVEADGTDATTVTVTLKNNGADVAGDLVSLSQGSGHAVISTADPVSNANGVATFTVVDLTPESVVLQAADLTTATTLDADQVVTFTTPPGGTLRPSVTGLSPASGPGAGGTDVDVTGTNLLGATGVWFGGVQSPTYSVNPDGTELTAVAPIPVASGAVNVTVTGPGGTSLTTAADIYTYTSDPPLDVSAIFPAYGAVAGGTAVTIEGTDLENAQAVEFGSQSATFQRTDGGQELTAVAPAGTSPGRVAVTVITTRGTSTASPETTFTFIGKAPPTTTTTPAVRRPAVTRVAPKAGALAGGNVVTLVGKNFRNMRYVLFGATRVKVHSLNHARTILTVLAPRVRTARTVSIVVVTTQGRSVVKTADRYTYRATGPLRRSAARVT